MKRGGGGTQENKEREKGVSNNFIPGGAKTFCHKSIHRRLLQRRKKRNNRILSRIVGDLYMDQLNCGGNKWHGSGALGMKIRKGLQALGTIGWELYVLWRRRKRVEVENGPGKVGRRTNGKNVFQKILKKLRFPTSAASEAR